MLKCKKILSLLCAVAMLFSMCSMFALAEPYSNPINVNGESYDNDKTPPAHDISVMSFNILQADGDITHPYAAPETRFQYAINTIKVYMPDLVGIQEASDTYNLTGAIDANWSWESNIIAAMRDLGYDCTSLSGQTGMDTGIGQGLILFYKSTRFTTGGVAGTDNGYTDTGTLTATYTNLNGGTSTRTDSGRYFHWVKLHDNTYDKDLYFYNTHMSINPHASATTDYDATIAKTIGAQFRTQIISQMLADVESRAKNYPCFMAGDYNTGMNGALTKDDGNFATHGQLGLLENYPYMSDSASTADTTISANATSRIDHVFVNSDYAKTVEHRAVQEGWNGQQVSDHFALVSYNNYSANVTFNNADGLFDRAADTFTATTDSTTYTFDITDNTASKNVTWKVNGSSNNTINLTKAVNTAQIVFSAGGQEINTVTATINYTGASKPSVTAQGAVGNYFANDAYQVVLNKNTSSVYLRISGGTIDGSKTLTLNNIAGGRTEYTVTATSGDTYPLYIYKETAEAETGNVIYVEDDIGDSTGIVPFYTGTDVILLEGDASNVFSNLEDVAAKYGAKSGYTVYMAPGQYLGNATYFTKNVTILGANHSTSALDADMNVNSARKEETVVVGSVAICCDDNCTYTVKGIHFDGPYNGYNNEFLGNNFDAAIQIHTELSLAKSLEKTATLDIQNNLFTGYGDWITNDSTRDSAIRSNTGLQKAGIIANNYFEYTGNEITRSNRAITFRNVNGLTIENNRFLNFPVPLWLSSECVDNGVKAGYANYTVQNNRFEACSSNTNGIYNITEDTSANINYYNNDFIRCGYYTDGNPIIEIALNDTTLAGSNYYSNVSVSIQGNKFLNCTRGIAINNNLNTAEEMAARYYSSINDMKVSINRNMFYLPLVRHVHNTYIHYSMRFSFFLDNTLTHDMPLNTENWNLKYNFFESPIYVTSAGGKTTYIDTDGTVYTDTNIVVEDVHNPVNYMNIKITNGDSSTSGNSFALSSSESEASADTNLYYPYYTDIAMTSLTLSDLTVTVDNVSVVYDGNEHTLGDITVKDGDTVIENALINYSTDGTNYSTVKPTFTEPGTHTVYWKAEMAGYDPATGTATVSITTPTDRVISVEDATFTYDGQPHALTYDLEYEGDVVTYTYAGDTYNEMPTFTDVGYYTVTVNVENPKKGNATATAHLEISKAAIEGVTILGNFDGRYTGKAHTITIQNQPEGTTAYYSVNGGEYTTKVPSIKDIGEYTVTVKISGANYNDYIDTVTINITEALITGVSVQGETAKVDGNNHGITVTGLVEGDKITFNDGTTTETVTAENSDALTYGEFAKAGSYQVTVTVERDNHIPKTFIASVNLTSGTTKQYFNLVDTDIAVVAGENDKSTFVWDTARSFTDAGAEAFALAAEGEIKIVSFGIKLAKTSEDLLEYQYQFQSGNIAADGSNKYQLSGAVFEINGNNANNPEGLSKVYSKSTYRITGVAKLQARYAMSYIRYIIDGVVYEDYGTILATSTILPDLDGDGNPDLGNIGVTDDREDILDDDTTGDIGDTEDREDILDDEETNEGGSAEDNTEVPNP